MAVAVSRIYAQSSTISIQTDGNITATGTGEDAALVIGDMVVGIGALLTKGQFYFVDSEGEGVALSTEDGKLKGSMIEAGSVGPDQLAEDAVGTGKIATGVVGSDEVAENSLTKDDLADNSVEAGEIATGAVGSDEVANNSLTKDDLADNSVEAGEIAAGAVGTSEVADNSLTDADLADGAVKSGEIDNRAVIPAKLDDAATYVVGKLGIGTSTVPRGGYGGALLALHGTDSSESGPHFRTTTSADDYPVLDFMSYTHDNAGIRFDCWWANSSLHSSDAGSNAAIYKYADTLMFKYAAGVAVEGTFTWTPAMHINLTNGSVLMQQVYSQTVGGTNRALYIDDTGKLGYLSSSIEFKENVRDVSEQDTSWIFSLRPVMFDYKDPTMGLNQCGLIAEEVATVHPAIVSYKREVTYGPEALDKNGNPDPSGDRPMVVTTTDQPETVNYERLTVPMLAEIQKLKKEIEDLKAEVAALKAKS